MIFFLTLSYKAKAAQRKRKTTNQHIGVISLIRDTVKVLFPVSPRLVLSDLNETQN